MQMSAAAFAASAVRSRLSKRKMRIGFPTGLSEPLSVSSDVGPWSGASLICPAIRRPISPAPSRNSSGSPESAGFASSGAEGENRAKRVSNSSGSSIFVITSIMLSEERGIASTISGISSASNPTSLEARWIISRNRFLAFSVP